MNDRHAAIVIIDSFFSAYALCAAADPDLFPPLAPGSLQHRDYAALESKIRFALPWSFKEWHRRHYSDALLDIAGMSLPLSPARHPLVHLRRELLEMNVGVNAIKSRVLPFSYSEATGHIVAFDARIPKDDCEWPIISFEHELSLSEALPDAKTTHECFAELLDSLAAFMAEQPKRWSELETHFIGDVPALPLLEPSSAAEDREFIARLGPERPDTSCKVPGCGRGAIALSVFCQRHHFESVWKRPWPTAPPGAA